MSVSNSLETLGVLYRHSLTRLVTPMTIFDTKGIVFGRDSVDSVESVGTVNNYCTRSSDQGVLLTVVVSV